MRTIDGQTLDPLGKFNELQTLVRGVLAPAYLLDYLRYFVLFEDDGGLLKKIAGYHQFHAVRLAITKVIEASRPGGNPSTQGKGGVVWHTQGSGKSITMTCFAARVMQEPAKENPTIVVISDRNDLDGQLFGVFSLAQDLLREQPVQARTRQELRTLLGGGKLKRPSGGIIFTTIQKFMPGEDEDTFPILSERHNIVVIADEAHRTQYGFEAKLRLKKTNKPLAQSIWAQEAPNVVATGDGIVTPHRVEFEPPIYDAGHYQAGYAQHLRDALPKATFVAFTGTPVSSSDRDTRAVFGDYIHVYDMQQSKEDGATVAIYYESRLAKLSLKDADLQRLNDDVDELAEDDEESQQAALKSRWAALEKVVGAEPRIASVAADLVAHFEERNRAQTGKAMVVAMGRDICAHIGIGNELKLAMKEYAASQGRGRPTVDAHEAFSLLLEKMDVLRAMLHGFDYSGFLTGGHKTLAGAANHVLGLATGKTRDGQKRFADNALAMSQAFTLCCTLNEAKAVGEEVAFLQGVKVILTKEDITAKKRTDEQRELAIRQIISSAVVSERVVDIFDAVGLDKPNIGLLSDEFLAQVRDLPEKNLAVELLERLLQGEIKSRFASSVVQNRKFSDMLGNVIARYQNRSIETAQVIDELIQMAKKFREASLQGEKLGLTEDEVRFYYALIENESAVRELSDDTLKKIAHELTENLRKNLSVDWSARESVQAKLRLMVKRILRKYKYPPDHQDAAVELVLEQVQAFGDGWRA